MVSEAQRKAAERPVADADPPPRWTLRRLVSWVAATFGRVCCRETIRAALRRLDLSWKKAKKLLGRADPAQRQHFVEEIQALLDGAQRDHYLLIFLDEAHIHLDTDQGYGWSKRGEPFWIASTSPGLSARVSFYGLYLYNEGQVRLWPYPCGNGNHTVDVLARLRAEFPEHQLIVIWDGVSYHRSAVVKNAAADLDIEVRRLPAYSPDFMPVEALWRWMREDVTYHYCHASADQLIRHVEGFETTCNEDPYAVADRLIVKDHLDPAAEKLRFSN